MHRRVPEYHQIILDSISEGVFTVDREWKINFLNRAAENITGIKREDAVGQSCWNVLRANICECDCALKATMETGKPISDKTVHIIKANGQRIPINISTMLLRDGNGNVIGGVETFRDVSAEEDLKNELYAKNAFADIVSRSCVINRIFNILPHIAESESTVLIEGESGTGKEMFARAIHGLSHRNERPLIVVNCGALPDTLLESELFGYKAGAFTDAKKDKLGRFALAEGGTIFLDEIADISPAVQVALLRVLQQKEYEPLGATKAVKANVRIICATNRNLETMVAKGTFREDLFYRINVVRIYLPPLRARKEDIPLLIDIFIFKFNRMKNKKIKGVTADAMNILMDYNFPGNIRELENIIEHAFVLVSSGYIDIKDLPEYLHPKHPVQISVRGKLPEMEARVILETLKKNDWKRLNTAQELGIDKTTLWRKIKQYGIKVPRGRRGRK